MQRIMLILSGIIFTLGAAAHATRLALEVEVLIGDWALPVWFSLPGALVAGLLAYFCFRAAGK